MKLIKDKKFLHNIAQFIDITNTLGGGIAQPQVKVDKREKGAVLQVLLPGVHAEQFQVTLDKNQLTVAAFVQSEPNPATHIPLFHHNFLLPPHIDYQRLRVEHAGAELRVIMPYLPKGPRVLPIEQL
ncbi:Hsp20/alpha crystallin family protein [Rufibacter sp. LB8]|uniref:Hsp20/alpha crystallin family protein n=1 Tax=Rufibacter sp. LB8 TaxID=2777781 RepID=UPI00178C6420|nr:Hsp20/alpha crystallin family protein [Rufibacter sp. LB8]